MNRADEKAANPARTQPPAAHPPGFVAECRLVERALRAADPAWSVAPSAGMAGWCRVEEPGVGPHTYCAGSHAWRHLLAAIRGAAAMAREDGR